MDSDNEELFGEENDELADQFDEQLARDELMDGTEPEEDSNEEESDSDTDSDSNEDDDDGSPSRQVSPSAAPSSRRPSPESRRRSPSLSGRSRSLSPATIRRRTLVLKDPPPRSYTIEAICALPHPTPIHALAASACFSHVATGCEDGYIRDYDIFSSVNSKNFLTAPQRSHCGVVEGLMKSGQLRCWWENPAPPGTATEEHSLAPVYSMLMHSDALWQLSGSSNGQINLFTVRHEPGRLCHTMSRHRGPVGALAMAHDEKGFLSAGWDGDAIQWDLNTGQPVRTFTSHGAQLSAIAVRPITSAYTGPDAPPAAPAGSRFRQNSKQESRASSTTMKTNSTASSLASQPNSTPMDTSESKAEAYDPLFDEYDPLFDDPETPLFEKPPPSANDHGLSMPGSRLAMPGTTGEGGFFSTTSSYRNTPGLPPIVGGAPVAARASFSMNSGARQANPTLEIPKNAPPVLDPTAYAAFSPDMFLTASIDGQVILWDKRVQHGQSNGARHGVGRLEIPEKTAPWCLSACWSSNGSQIYVGRRKSTVDVWDMRQLGRTGPASTPRLLKSLKNPPSSGVVSCVVAFPDGKHIATASVDNIRLWNAVDANEPDASGKVKSGVQFKIVPGHHGGYISQMLVDPCARFLISASSNRGWNGDSTRSVFVHEIKHVY